MKDCEDSHVVEHLRLGVDTSELRISINCDGKHSLKNIIKSIKYQILSIKHLYLLLLDFNRIPPVLLSLAGGVVDVSAAPVKAAPHGDDEPVVSVEEDSGQPVALSAAGLVSGGEVENVGVRVAQASVVKVSHFDVKFDTEIRPPLLDEPELFVVDNGRQAQRLLGQIRLQTRNIMSEEQYQSNLQHCVSKTLYLCSLFTCGIYTLFAIVHMLKSN